MRGRLHLVPLAILYAVLSYAAPASAQPGPGGPPAVGTAVARKRPVVESTEFVGRVVATDRVDIVARVTAFIQERAFVEGAEVNKGDLLYRLERGPFESDVESKQAAVAQAQALLRNATITLNRAQSLINSPAGLVSAVDNASAQQASLTAQFQAAQAQLRASQISLDYTEIRAPVSGKIGRTALTVGNVVTPNSGPLVVIVSQDPMYVLFPVSVRAAVDLRNRYADTGGFAAIQVRLRLPDGSMYGPLGQLDYADPSVATGTDTINLRARIANPLRRGAKLNDPGNRDLLDSEFVTVVVEGVAPVEALSIPRVAVLSDQQGTYVYVVDADRKAQQRRVVLGQSVGTEGVVLNGLQEGDVVIADGMQRARPGVVVNPTPIPQPPATQVANQPPAATRN
jgi:membrane fusion protein (multidrug efflux system)